MQLNLEQIRSVTQGAVWVEQRGQCIVFHRDTPAQEAAYCGSAYRTELCTAGVRLEFETDSRSLLLRTQVRQGVDRGYFLFEIHCNGARIGTLGNIGDDTPLFDAQGMRLAPERFTMGSFEKTFALGAGNKRICIYFPWSAIAVLEQLCLDDGARLVPLGRRKKLLMFGDSITQGYDARYPSQSYAARLTDALDAAAINKGYGGDTFRPALLAQKEAFLPDYITVAYGTNDWKKLERAVFEENCAAFYNTLAAQYPASRIFAITPIWRKDGGVSRLGRPQDVTDFIEKTVSPLPNVVLLRGDAFVPPDTALFADRRLHPNDDGFAHYFNALNAAMQPYL